MLFSIILSILLLYYCVELRTVESRLNGNSILRIDAAYCYRRSSVICLSVCRSVCHNHEPCKNGWSPSELWTRAGRMNHLLDKGQDSHGKKQVCEENGAVQGLYAVSCAKTAEAIEMPFGDAESGGCMEPRDGGCTLTPPDEYE